MPSQLVPCACACAVLPWQGEVAFLMGLLQRMLEEEAEEKVRNALSNEDGGEKKLAPPSSMAPLPAR